MWSPTRLLLLLIFLNDLHSSSKILKFILFADDINTFFTHKDTEIHFETVNNKLKKSQ